MKKISPLYWLKVSGSLVLLVLLTFFFINFININQTSAQVCAPSNAYLVWSGTWEPGRIPMASNSQYFLTASPIFVSSGGNVGIGTNNPVYKLQVQGDISGTSLCIGNDCRSVWPENDCRTSWPSGGSFQFHYIDRQTVFARGSFSGMHRDSGYWITINMPAAIPTTASGVIITFHTVADERIVWLVFRSNKVSARLVSHSNGGNNSDDAASDINTMILPYTSTFDVLWFTNGYEPDAGAAVYIDGYVQ